MTSAWTKQISVIALFLAAVAALGAGVWRYGYGQALDSLAEKGKADLALSADRVVGQLQRYRELAVLLADHPVVAQITGAPFTHAGTARGYFERVADKTSALDILYVDQTGMIRAAARGATDRTVAQVGFVQRAMQGALGSGHGTDMLVAQRAYYYAAPHFLGSGSVGGVVIVAADIGEIEWEWAGSNPPVFFTDAAGEVFITNRSDLISWHRPKGAVGLVPHDAPSPPVEVSRISGHTLWSLEWGPYLPSHALHLSQDLPVIGMRAEALIDTAPALRLAGLQAAAVVALCLAFGAMLFLATERRRALADANAKLEARVAKRTRALSDTNTALRREVHDRQEAEAALRKAQEDLVQAGKLSALGQMSAGISHELNQPLMAIQSFAENGTAFLAREQADKAADNLRRISALATRMGRIIRNLRAFARQESAPVNRVDLTSVIETALDLTETVRSAADVVLHYEAPPAPIWVQGGDVRLTQVFVNLITNAVDAMDGRDTRELTIRVTATPEICVQVQDTGPGIDMPDKVFEPFYTTKMSKGQEGMGLGLSISYGIVQSVGGVIHGSNAPQGGAIFTVALEGWPAQAEAAE